MKYFIKCIDKVTKDEYCISELDVLLKSSFINPCYAFNSETDAQEFLNTKLLEHTDYTYDKYNIEIVAKNV